MEYIIKTNKGIAFTIDGTGLDLKAYSGELNNRNIMALPFMEMVLSKNNIQSIMPKEDVEDGPDVYELFTTDGTKRKIIIENYDVIAVAGSFNSPTNDFVLIGNAIINRHNFDLIKAL